MEFKKAYICQHQELKNGKVCADVVISPSFNILVSTNLFQIWKLWSKVRIDDTIFGCWYSETTKLLPLALYFIVPLKWIIHRK